MKNYPILLIALSIIILFLAGVPVHSQTQIVHNSESEDILTKYVPSVNDEEHYSQNLFSPKNMLSPQELPSLIYETGETPAQIWIDQGFIHWNELGNWDPPYPPDAVRTHRKPLYGGNAIQITSGLQSAVLSTLDNTGGYYIDEDYDSGWQTTLSKRTHANPTTEILIDQLPGLGITTAFDTQKIYYLHVRNGNGTIFRANKDGSNIEQFVTFTSSDYYPDFLVNDGYIYWTTDSGIWREGLNCSTLPCSGELFVSGNYPSQLTFHNSYLYWVTEQSIRRSPLSCTSLPCTHSQVVPDFSDPNNSYILANGNIFWVHDNQILRKILVNHETTAIYAAPENWHINSEITLNQNHIFWVEEETESNVSDRIRRMPLLGGQAISIAFGDLDPSWYGYPVSPLPLFFDDWYLYFFADINNKKGIYRLPINASPIQLDFKVEFIEITQGIQNLANTVPLVEDKSTYVRVYAREVGGSSANAVNMKLTVYRGGIPFGVFYPEYTVPVDNEYDRAKLGDSFLFKIPSHFFSFLDPTLTFEATIDPFNIYDDVNLSNNTIMKTIVVHDTKDLCLVFVPVNTNDTPRPSMFLEGTNKTIIDPNFLKMIANLEQLWPSSRVQFYELNYYLQESRFHTRPFEMDEDSGKILRLLQFYLRGNTYYNLKTPCGYHGYYAVGMIHPDDTNTQYLGLAYRDSWVSWIKLPTDADFDAYTDIYDVLPHELAHNIGRKHILCTGDEKDIDSGHPNYPDPWCQIDDAGLANDYGFNFSSMSILEPDRVADIMTYARPNWMSSYTYEAIFDSVESTSQYQAQEAESGISSAEILLVSGAITTTTQTGYLDHAWKLPVDFREPSKASTEENQTVASSDFTVKSIYHIQLLAADGTILDDQVVTPADVQDGDSIETVEFLLTFSAPEQQVAQINLLIDDQVVSSLQPGSSEPKVTILEPTSTRVYQDNMTISWMGTDTDANDSLWYIIQYSPDGGQSWLLLGADVSRPQNTDPLTLYLDDLNWVPGSTQGLVRIIASDGINTTIAFSDIFEVAEQAPLAFINSPELGQSFPAGPPVTLRGGAMDIEDSRLLEGDLEWDIDEYLTIQGESDIVVEGLAPGNHSVQLTATDSSGLKGTITATLQIDPLFVQRGGEPELDGFCNDLQYKNAVNVQLEPYANNSQATVMLLHTDTHLWACFMGLQWENNDQSFAGLRVDVNNSGESQIQLEDLGFFVHKDGTFLVQNGNGDSVNQPQDGLQARISAYGNIWNAELRIDQSNLGGWYHKVRLDLLHHEGDSTGNDYHWPYNATNDEPNTWAETKLGSSNVFLPFIGNNSYSKVTLPDLIVTDLFMDNETVEVEILNQGNTPVTEPFWVDVYFDPNPPPTAVNQIWNDGRSQYGLVWGVVDKTILPGATLKLIINDAYYWSNLSNPPESLSQVAVAYVQVDSANTETDYGNVLEIHEFLDQEYNNIVGPIIVSALDNNLMLPTGNPASEDLTNQMAEELPDRPDRR